LISPVYLNCLVNLCHHLNFLGLVGEDAICLDELELSLAILDHFLFISILNALAYLSKMLFLRVNTLSFPFGNFFINLLDFFVYFLVDFTCIPKGKFGKELSPNSSGLAFFAVFKYLKAFFPLSFSLLNLSIFLIDLFFLDF